MKNSAASSRRPDATRSWKVSAVSSGGLGAPSGRNGGSHIASFVIGSREIAASIASAAPEDDPNRNADPPAASATASMSSTSRWTAYGGVSPLSPRPRRS